MTKENLPAAPIEGGLSTLDTELIQKALAEPAKMKNLLVVIDEEIAKFSAPDISTAKGRDAIKANAFIVTRSKTAIEGIGKELTADARALITKLNEQRNIAVEHLANKAKEVRKPLTDWEEAEEKRKVALAEGLVGLLVTLEMGANGDEIHTERERIQSLYDETDWQEMAEEASNRIGRAAERLDELQAFYDEQERQRKEAEEARQAAAKAEGERQAAEQRAQEAEAAAEALRAKEREAEADRLAEETRKREAVEAELAELRAAQQAAIDKAEAEAKASDAEPEATSDAELAEDELAPAGANPEAEIETGIVSRETPDNPTADQLIKSLEYVHDNADLANPHRTIIMDAISFIRRTSNV